MTTRDGAPVAEAAPRREGSDSGRTRRGETRARGGPGSSWPLLALVPALLVGVLLAVLVLRGVGLEDRGLPPVEELTITRIELPAPGQLRVHVVNSGPESSTISQVLVDEAYWAFRVHPSGTLGRLDRAVVDVTYPWVFSEPHEIALLTSTGLTFTGEIAVAVESPRPSGAAFLRFGVLGLYVGVLPVALGLLLFPALRRLGRRGVDFLLSLTVGLLVFLAVDTLLEALEMAGSVAGVYQAQPLVLLAAFATVLVLAAAGRMRGRRGFTPLGLAYLIALGIGLHNLGEGLAIGAAFALGELALGSFLVIGFTLHNVTEGIGIAAPILRERPPLRHFALLTLLAGFPAAVGTWIGAFSYSPLASAIFLGVGAGAILQVVYEVSRLLARGTADEPAPLLSGWNLAGLLLGIGVMYGTALLVAA